MTAHQPIASSAADASSAGIAAIAETAAGPSADATASGPRADWDRRMAELWAAIDAHERDAFLVAVDELAGEQSEDLADAVFHRVEHEHQRPGFVSQARDDFVNRPRVPAGVAIPLVYRSHYRSLYHD